MRILLILTVLISSTFGLDILDIQNRYDFTRSNDFISINGIDYYATNSGIIIDNGSSLKEKPFFKEGEPIGRVVSLFYKDSVLWLGTESRGLFYYNLISKESKRSTELDNISINSVCYDTNSLYLASSEGLIYFDSKTMLVADNIYKNFGSLDGSLEKVTILLDTIIVKHDEKSYSKVYKKAFLGNKDNWINFIDSSNTLFKNTNRDISDEITSKLGLTRWYRDLYDVVSGNGGVFLAANFRDGDLSNVIKINDNQFDHINCKSIKDIEYFNIDVYGDILSITKIGYGMTAYSISEDREIKRYNVGVMPGRQCEGSVALDNDNIAVINSRMYKPNTDDGDRSKLNYDGGITIVSISKDSSYNIIKDSTQYLYNMDETPKINMSVNMDLDVTENNWPEYISKISDSLHSIILSDGNFVIWNNKSTYLNTKDDTFKTIKKLSFGVTPTSVAYCHGNVIASSGSKIDFYNGVSLTTGIGLDKEIIDMDFINDSTLIFLHDYSFSIVNSSDFKTVVKEVHLVDLNIADKPKKISVDRKNSRFYIATDYSITDVKYVSNSNSIDYDNSRKLGFYPNPYYKSKGDFSIINLPKDASITIYNSLAKVVNRFKTPYNSSVLTWDGSNSNGIKVSSGVYYIVVTDENGDTKFKLLVL